MATLVAADYVVIGVLMAISSGIGVYYWLTGGRQKSTEVIISRIPVVRRILSAWRLNGRLLFFLKSSTPFLKFYNSRYYISIDIIGTNGVRRSLNFIQVSTKI